MNKEVIQPDEIIIKWCKKNKPNSILDLSGWDITELPDMPDSVEYLDISNTNIKKLQRLPTNLKWLKCNLTPIEEFPESLPSNLKYINCVCCDNLKPFSIPKGIKIKESFKEYIENKELQTENHEELAKKRIEELNVKKNPRNILDLSGLKIEVLPEIPDEVEQMNCDGMRLKSLKGLPKNLKRLSCSGYTQKVFDYLPEGLEYLKSNWSQYIETIDNLPSSLKKLEMGYYTAITRINKLPPNLRHLDLNHADMLKEINCPFPETLRYIDLTMTRIKYLPRLPESVRILDIKMNYDLKTILNLPNNLKYLNIRGTSINSLPQLPETLMYLYMKSIKILNNNSLPKSLCILESLEINLESNNIR
jgi:hypothetical protein